MAEIFVSAFGREKQMHCSLWNQNLTNLIETVSTAVVQRGPWQTCLCVAHGKVSLCQVCQVFTLLLPEPWQTLHCDVLLLQYLYVNVTVQLQHMTCGNKKMDKTGR